jgi:hypothetical protein
MGLAQKAKNYAVFCFAGASPEKDFFFYIYDVITSPEKEKSSANHYYCIIGLVMFVHVHAASMSVRVHVCERLIWARICIPVSCMCTHI